MTNELLARITDAIIDRLEQGTAPWHRPWRQGSASMPTNLASGRRYRGINVFVLALQRYQSPYWLTFRQATQLGGSVRKGERGTIVVYWNWVEKEPESPGDKAERIPFLRCYSVFNSEQCDGVPVPQVAAPVPSDVKPIDKADAIVRGFRDGPGIEHLGNQALYRPTQDRILMPPFKTFEKAEEYYSTLFHELTHSTGHAKRLNRSTLTDLCPFGSTNYSREELVAEMGAALLCGECGIENRTIDNSAAYIAGWLTKLQNDRRMLIVAAAQAQKATDHIRGTAGVEQSMAA